MHHIESEHGSESIRCDDFQHDTLIERNVIYRQGGMGTGVTSKGINDICNNFIVDPVVPRLIRGMISLEIAPVNGSRIERNIMYATSSEQASYYQDRLYGNGAIPKLKDTHADWNLYFNGADQGWGDRHLETERLNGIEVHSMSADPRFYDVRKEDFRLLPDSPCWMLGIDPIDLSEAGLTTDYGLGDPTEPLRQLYVRSGRSYCSLDLLTAQTAELEVIGKSETGYKRKVENSILTFASQNVKIADVDANGRVTGLQPGSTVIRAILPNPIGVLSIDIAISVTSN